MMTGESSSGTQTNVGQTAPSSDVYDRYQTEGRLDTGGVTWDTEAEDPVRYTGETVTEMLMAQVALHAGRDILEVRIVIESRGRA